MEIPVFHGHSQQALRLLELPTELLEVVTSDSPQILFFKSGPIDGASKIAVSSSSLSPSHVTICTSNRTFQIRHVQTSNSIFLLQPALDVRQNVKFATSALCIVANCTSTLESYALNPQISPMTRLLVPYDVNFPGNPHETIGRSKASMLADFPYSHGEFQRYWADLVAFEINGIAYMPSDDTLIKLWDAIFQVSMTLTIDLEKPFDKLGIWAELQDSGYPKSLFCAVMARVSADQPESLLIAVVKDRCILWLGSLLANSIKLASDEHSLSGFLEEWRALVPEKWADEITSEKFVLLTAHGVNTCFEMNSGPSTTIRTRKKDTKPPIGKRDWHEKFKTSRRER